MFQLGLRGKLALVLGGIALLAFALVYFASTSLTTSMLMEEEVRVVRQTGDMLVPLLLNLARDPEEVDMALSKAAQGGRLETVQVLNGQLETSAPRDCRPAEVLVGRQRLEELAANGGRVGRVRSPTVGQLFASVRPIPGGGFLFAARSAKFFEEKRRSLVTLLVLWGAVLMLAIFLSASILLRTIVTRPIGKLVEEASAVAAGGKGFDAEEMNTDEFGVLRTSLASMAEKLLADRARIENQVDELQQVNRELTDAHDRLVRTEKLASVGQLAAGVAHEIGNPISIVLGYLDLLQKQELAGGQSEILGKIRKATERIDTTLRNLMDFSRPAQDEQLSCHLASGAKEVMELVSPQKQFRVVEMELDNRLDGPVACAIPPSRFKQVLLNLLFNAADAMDGRGGLKIVLESAGPGRASLAVSDTGPGIAHDLYLKIFDPFFTTKEVGKGTGLGLFVCHTIVSRYGGQISVGSSPGEGATFTVILPVVSGDGPEQSSSGG